MILSMIEGFGPNNASINQLLLNAKNGRGVQAHGKPSQSCVAAFLIGAGYRAFFGVGGWSEKGKTFDDHYMSQFALPLGNPLSDAKYDKVTSTWSRKFSKGVEVSFDCKGNKGVVKGWTWPPDPSE